MTDTARLIMTLALTVALGPALAATPAAADWLVTTDGERVETRGPWEVKGRMVVFTSADGVLSSMRLSHCDLEASEAATAAAREVKPAPPRKPERKPVVLVLTDADVGHVPPAKARTEDAEEEVDAEEAAQVVVDEWRATDEDDGVAITGILRNNGPHVAGDVRVVATFRDVEGEEIERRSGAISTSTLKPGQKAQFRVPAFGLFSYGQVEFDVEHFDLLTAAQSRSESER